MKQVKVIDIARGNYKLQNEIVNYLEKSDLKQIISDTVGSIGRSIAF